jgi:hypothetical protein
LKTQTVGIILITLPASLTGRKPTPPHVGDRRDGLLVRISKVSLATFSIGIAFLIELLAAAQDEIRNHDEKTNSGDGPDNRNVVHGGLLSEALACKVPRLKRNMS